MPASKAKWPARKPKTKRKKPIMHSEPSKTVFFPQEFSNMMAVPIIIRHKKKPLKRVNKKTTIWKGPKTKTISREERPIELRPTLYWNGEKIGVDFRRLKYTEEARHLIGNPIEKMSDKIYRKGSIANRNTFRKGVGAAKKQQQKRSVAKPIDKEIQEVNEIASGLKFRDADRKALELKLRKLKKRLNIPETVLEEILGHKKRT